MKTPIKPSYPKIHDPFILLLSLFICFNGNLLYAQSVEIIGDKDSIFTKKILIEKIPLEFIPSNDVGSQSYSTLNSVAVGKSKDKFDKVYFDVTDYELTKYGEYDNEKGYVNVLYVLLDVDKSEYKKSKGVFPVGIKRIEVIKGKNNILKRLNTMESEKSTYKFHKNCDVMILLSYNS